MPYVTLLFDFGFRNPGSGSGGSGDCKGKKEKKGGLIEEVTIVGGLLRIVRIMWRLERGLIEICLVAERCERMR